MRDGLGLRLRTVAAIIMGAAMAALLLLELPQRRGPSLAFDDLLPALLMPVMRT